MSWPAGASASAGTPHAVRSGRDPAPRGIRTAAPSVPRRHRDRQHGVAQVGGGNVTRARSAVEGPHQPRPGHADLAGMQKYGFADARDVSSARRPVRPRPGGSGRPGQSAAGRAGRGDPEPRRRPRRHETPHGVRPRPGDLAAVDASTVRCFDADTEDTMVAEVKARRRTATPWAASSRCSPTVCPSGWAATSTGTENSTHSWRRPS